VAQHDHEEQPQQNQKLGLAKDINIDFKNTGRL
jgi:hypothetical protein